MKSIFNEIVKSSDPYSWITENFKNSKNHFTKTIGQAVGDSFGKVFTDKTSELNKLDVFESPSHQHTVIYYIVKTLMAVYSSEISAAAISLAKAKDNMSESDPKGISCWLEFLEGKMLGHYARIQVYSNIIKKLNIKIDFDYWLWVHCARDLASDGFLNIDISKSDIKYRYDSSKYVFSILFFCNTAGKGKVEEARKLYTAIPAKYRNDLAVDYHLKMLDIIEGKLDKKYSVKSSAETNFFELDYDYFIALRKNKPVEALEIARKMVRIGSDPLFKYPQKILANAEICNKNIEAAAHLISGLKDSLDDADHLMIARIEYHKNNIPESAKHFQYALSQSIKQDRFEWFSFQLKCAVDLNSFDIFTIMNQAKTKSKKENATGLKSKMAVTPIGMKLIGADKYIGRSESTQRAKERIKQYSQIEAPVLITGETGVGKEVVALAIHEESSRAKEPFLPINCGAIVDNLLQSELFGYEAGAFTSAQKSHVGIFEAAGKGTVFLDEFGEMSFQTQIALLRVFETKRIKPIGSNHSKKINCHIIAATNVNLEDQVKEGTFRSDLYYRIKSFEIKLKPLRQRKKDIVDLVIYFLNIGREEGECATISKSAAGMLTHYYWPGNTRELKNEIEKTRILNSNKTDYVAKDFTFLNKDIEPAIQTTESAEIVATADTVELVVSMNTSSRRLDKIKELFKKHKILRRVELINTFKIAHTTASKDLKILVKENYIKKVMPTTSPRTHYFELI